MFEREEENICELEYLFFTDINDHYSNALIICHLYILKYIKKCHYSFHLRINKESKDNLLVVTAIMISHVILSTHMTIFCRNLVDNLFTLNYRKLPKEARMGKRSPEGDTADNYHGST